MQQSRWLPCVWPGLAELWLEGSWSGLALATAFAGLLNSMLALSLVWTGWASDELRFAGWTAVVTMWLLGAWGSYRRMTVDRPALSGDLFSQAVTEYLQGNYVAAESILGQVMRKDRRDADAQLLLVSLLRRTRRLDEAQQRLNQLEQFRGAEKWRLEIERERKQLDLLKTAAAGGRHPQTAAAEPTDPETTHHEINITTARAA